MRFLWDASKKRTNSKNHKIEFTDASVALEDENALTVIDEDSQNEYRFKTLCVGSLPLVLMVVHTEELDVMITIMSFGFAEPSERKQYYKGIINGY